MKVISFTDKEGHTFTRYIEKGWIIKEEMDGDERYNYSHIVNNIVVGKRDLVKIINNVIKKFKGYNIELEKRDVGIKIIFHVHGYNHELRYFIGNKGFILELDDEYSSVREDIFTVITDFICELKKNIEEKYGKLEGLVYSKYVEAD